MSDVQPQYFCQYFNVQTQFWIISPGYQTVLQRLCSTATICATSSQTDTVNVNGGDLGPDFDLGFISHAQFDTTMNHDVVRSMLFSGPWSCRLRHMHGYLTSYLPVYASNCCAIYPPSSLLLPVPSTSTDLNITMKTYTSNLSLGSSVEMENIYNSSLDLDPRPLPPGTQANPHKPVDEAIVNHGDNELVLQWHQPTLDESDPAHTEMGSLDRRIILLYALSRKGSSGSPGVAPGFLWVSQPQLIDLHDRYISFHVDRILILTILKLCKLDNLCSIGYFHFVWKRRWCVVVTQITFRVNQDLGANTLGTKYDQMVMWVYKF